MNKQREYEDTIGTLPAEVLETRINQLKALRGEPITPFKPMPGTVDPRSGGGNGNGGKSFPQEEASPSADPSVSSTNVIVVTSDPEPSTTVLATSAPTVMSSAATDEGDERPQPTVSTSSAPSVTVDGGRRNVRRRTNRPVSKRDKERITAQLSDVSLD
ncbi:hypothetical protein ZHAS_00010015 [Anopheles sinensis]|uniref:Uncharacterized protein n=1 Tax=Anopheles sinensis TaxID=74873 RepID=A0A084VWI3_ANOSI|nr:hypothetical protein ZHAS_00010015 [Anopheles sinensis]